MGESMDLEPLGMEGVTHSTKSCVRCLELTIRCSHMIVTGNLDPNSTVPDKNTSRTGEQSKETETACANECSWLFTGVFIVEK